MGLLLESVRRGLPASQLLGGDWKVGGSLGTVSLYLPKMVLATKGYLVSYRATNLEHGSVEKMLPTGFIAWFLELPDFNFLESFF